MTEQGRKAAQPWQNEGFAHSWAASDRLADILVFPRRIAVALAGVGQGPRLVIDIGSGPGAFLEAFLDEYPLCHGVWHDASEAMLGLGRQRLARFGDRVEFRLGDMTDLAGSQLPTEADVIATSRAAHHLDRDALHVFYRVAAQHLAPGGWLVNLDHIGAQEHWDQRLRAIRGHFTHGSDGPKHHHDYPLTSIDDHLRGYAAAGITDVDVVWRALYTCLFVGRKDG